MSATKGMRLRVCLALARTKPLVESISLACPAETRSNGVNEINNNKWLEYCYNNWGAGGVQQESMPDKKSLIIIGLG